MTLPTTWWMGMALALVASALVLYLVYTLDRRE